MPGYLVEALFSGPESVDRRRHAAVENHLGDDLADLLLGHTDVKGALDVTADHVRTVAQHG
ncbi:MAG: hypothetical protein J4N90_02155 [Chloroflexi bacterium]|nr:hypothetical protein [Chloroflexota bacterium]MCI0823523.1 hypothetical protein [Chloroflexota bacterium]